MTLKNTLRAAVAALVLGVAACGGSDIASPGATNPGTPPGGGGGGGGSGGGGSTATCPTGFTQLAAIGANTVCQITGTLLSNLTVPFRTGVVYRISGRVDVGADIGGDGARPGGQRTTLTIEPGVRLFGESGGDYIVVNRGSQIVADGTAAAPIVFTSRQDIAGTVNAENDIGQWGGLVILGRAPIKNCNAAGVAGGSAACENAIEGVSGTPALYGGAIPTDRSGKLDYVQVRFAGFPLPGTAGNELNGITFGGVGSDTEVSYIQVHNNADDGVEYFGGTVNTRYLVLTGNDDDSIDYDTGYTGNIQFALVRQRAGGGDNIVEASNAGSGASPNANPTISNFTLIGARTNAFRMNSTTSGTFVNGVVQYTTQCFRFESSAGNPTFRSVLFDCAGGLATSNSDVPRITGIVNTAGNNNTTTTPNTLAGVFPGANELAQTAVNPTTLGSFFQAGTYLGAFGPSENEGNSWASGWTYQVFASPACPAGTTESGTLNGQRLCVLSGTLTTNTRLVRGNIYQISGRVDVGRDVGGDAAGTRPNGVRADLSIDAGVTLFGASGADYVVVNRGSRLFSNGTRAAPVVFTSQRDLNNAQQDPANAIGEWGGVVILGRAPIKNCSAAGVAGGTAGCENAIEGVSGTPALYGGEVTADNSGALTFTQVKFAGFPLPGTAGNELNGITFGGVGSATNVQYIQVHNNADDGVEYFGGNVNTRYLVLTGNDDDSIDYDTGYTGNIQFAIVTQRSAGGDNIVEASNAGSAASPNANPTISNFTFVGGRTNAFRMNSTTAGRYVNGVVNYATSACFRFESSAGNPSFDSILFDCGGGLATSNSDTARITSLVGAGANNSTAVADTLTNTFVNGATETARPAVAMSALPAFFQQPNFLGATVNYIGAVQSGSDTWWRGWSCGLEASAPC
jgi:uncharacterized membrane protein